MTIRQVRQCDRFDKRLPPVDQCVGESPVHLREQSPDVGVDHVRRCASFGGESAHSPRQFLKNRRTPQRSVHRLFRNFKKDISRQTRNENARVEERRKHSQRVLPRAARNAAATAAGSVSYISRRSASATMSSSACAATFR